ncbi:kinesin-like protein KIN-7C, mitochondrial [Senna tora]|uniref:Kinesin-like protein KIN-7C, mitochondrial n=1 Tax=Senna tora TaxID=362788 RepID=A0A834W2J0_9FABA|nr:kinesin-like protein KIN-7C, mitochondrial [Senna tora]
MATRSAPLPHILALELRSRTDDLWVVAWSGATSASAAIEVSQQSAECISLPHHAKVQSELNSEQAEAAILNQLRIVYEGMRFPLWLHGHTMITFNVASVFPKKAVDTTDWSIHNEVINVVLDESHYKEDEEVANQSENKKGLQHLLRFWYIAQLDAITSFTGMEVNALVLGSKTLLHFEGSGKTLLARTVAKCLEKHEDIVAHKIFVSCSKLSLEKVPMIQKEVTNIIMEALDHAPSIVIFDDLDSIISTSDSEGSQPSISAAGLAGEKTKIMWIWTNSIHSFCTITREDTTVSELFRVKVGPLPYSDILVLAPENVLHLYPAIFENNNVLLQLRCGGVMEAIRISCAGYPTRKTFDEFVDRFGLLAPEALDGSSDEVTACKRILEKVGLKGYQIGKTKVFLRAGQMAELDTRRSEILGKSASIIQRKSQCRKYLAKLHFRKLKKATITRQCAWRGKIAWRELWKLKMVDMEEAKTQENKRLQSSLHEMQLQFKETKALLEKEREAAKRAAEIVLIIKEVPVIDHALLEKLTSENEKLKTLVCSLEKKIGETEKRYEEANKISGERLKQAMEAESKIIQLKTSMQRLEEKFSNIESENQVLQYQPLRNPSVKKMSEHLSIPVAEKQENGHPEVEEHKAGASTITESPSVTPVKKFGTESDSKLRRSYTERQHPIAAISIYKCLLHWKSFEAERTSVFDPLIQMIGSAIEGTYVEGINEKVVLSPGHALSLIALGEGTRNQVWKQMNRGKKRTCHYRWRCAGTLSSGQGACHAIGGLLPVLCTPQANIHRPLAPATTTVMHVTPTSSTAPDVGKAKENVTVTVRFRPLSARELNKGDEIAWYADGDHIVRNEHNPSVAYGFDKVFGPATTTRHVYDLVDGAMEEINGTVFAYGVTSSGKTHTMHGEQKSPGIIPLAVKDVFSIIQETPGREFLLRVSYLEIYNEVINDLLNPTGQNLRIREDAQGTYAEGIKEEVVLSPAHALSLIATGEDCFHQTIESSSHGEDTGEEDVILSHLHLIDLAGSESSKTETTGLRRKEGSYINKSLLTLGTVISKLTDGKAIHIPYRDSKLTRLLQSSLSGHRQISLICTVTPASSSSEETHNTLKFASRSKHVEIKAAKNKIMDEKSLIKKYQREIHDLKQELQQLKHGIMENPNVAVSSQEDLVNLKLQLEAGQSILQSRLEEEEQAKAALMGRIQRLTKLILLAYMPDRKRDHLIDDDSGSHVSELSVEGKDDVTNLDELMKDYKWNKRRGMLGWFKMREFCLQVLFECVSKDRPALLQVYLSLYTTIGSMVDQVTNGTIVCGDSLALSGFKIALTYIEASMTGKLSASRGEIVQPVFIGSLKKQVEELLNCSQELKDDFHNYVKSGKWPDGESQEKEKRAILLSWFLQWFGVPPSSVIQSAIDRVKPKLMASSVPLLRLLFPSAPINVISEIDVCLSSS